MKLYELPNYKEAEVDVNGVKVIFHHIDGMYSYCWLKDNPEHLVHLMIGTELEKQPDGTYKTLGDIMLPPDNTLDV